MSQKIRTQTNGKRIRATNLPAGGRTPGKGRLRRRNSKRRSA